MALTALNLTRSNSAPPALADKPIGGEAAPSPSPSQPQTASETLNRLQRRSSAPAGLSVAPRAFLPKNTTPDADVRQATSVAAQAAAASVLERQTRREGIKRLLDGYFKDFVTDENKPEFEKLIEDRTPKLLAMGHSEDSIKALMSKATTRDWLAHITKGAIGSAPFGIMSRVDDTQPPVNNLIVGILNALPFGQKLSDDFKKWFAAGLAAGFADHIGSEALRPAMADTQYLSATKDQLEPVMAEAKDTKQPGAHGFQEWGENALAIQAFTARNFLRVGVLAQKAKESIGIATTFDSWISAAGSLVAGAAFSAVKRGFDIYCNRIGPAYLLGRTDWESQLKGLDKETWPDTIGKGAARITKAVANLGNAIPNALHTFTSSGSLASNGALAVGFGTVGLIKSETSGTPASRLTHAHLKQTLASAAVYAAYMGGTQAGPWAAKKLSQGVSAAGDWAQSRVHAGVTTSAEFVGGAIDSGVQSLGDQVTAWRRANPPEGMEMRRRNGGGGGASEDV